MRTIHTKIIKAKKVTSLAVAFAMSLVLAAQPVSAADTDTVDAFSEDILEESGLSDYSIENMDIPEEELSVLPADVETEESFITDDLISEDEGEEATLEDGIMDFPEEDVTEDGFLLEAAEEDSLSGLEDIDSTESIETEAGLGGGNVEQFTDPVLLEKMGIGVSESESDPDGLIYAADSTINYVYHYAGKLPASVYSGISIKQSGSTVTVSVNGSLPSGYSFINLGVDFNPVLDISGKRTGTWKINMNNYETGYHTIVLSLSNGTNAGIVGRTKMVSNTISERPTSNGVFDVYSSYFNYYPYGSFGNSAGTLYMEYSANGGKTWQRSGYMKYNLITTASAQGYKISGLREKTTYRTRIRYGEYVTYETDAGGDGRSYFFGGPVLNTTTIRTGSSTKPKIKSVTLKATKVKYHKLRWPGYYNVVGGSVFWHSSYVERFYTAKVKVTVTLKKKPGTNGVFISLLGQTKWKKGNKKKYTVTFTPTYNYWVKNPHSGKYKLTVQVCSGQSKDWGGFSPVVSKNKKVR